MPRDLAVLDKSIYIHQSNHFPDDPDWRGVCRMVRNAGANLVKLKALDGNEWMSSYDRVDVDSGRPARWDAPNTMPAPWAVTGPARWDDLKAIAEQEALTLIPWCVPHGFDLDLEVGMLLRLAEVSGNLIELDIEPYPGFWQGDREGLLTLVNMLHTAGVRVWMDLDSRRSAADQLPLYDLAGQVERFLSQDYWTTFLRAETLVIRDSADLFAGIVARDWGSIFPHDGAGAYRTAANLAAERDAAEIGLWLLDYATPATLEAFQALK